MTIFNILKSSISHTETNFRKRLSSKCTFRNVSLYMKDLSVNNGDLSKDTRYSAKETFQKWDELKFLQNEQHLLNEFISNRTCYMFYLISFSINSFTSL